jgi:hypothetical protein
MRLSALGSTKVIMDLWSVLEYWDSTDPIVAKEECMLANGV